MQKVRGSNPRSSTSPRDPPPSHPSPNGGGCAIREARSTVTVTGSGDRTRLERYDPTAIEPRWQARWDEIGLYETDLDDESRPKSYILTMYPYPSGDLHIGHWYIVTPTDALARFHRMHGENVFFPIGFDAYGLPAENAAIKNGINPRDWTMQNIERERRQFRSMGAVFDWRYEIVTCDPEFYRWNQWLFLRFLEAGLAYRRMSPVDWCPNDGTLAREQVEGADRHCWRCGAPVEKRDLEQWYLRTTKYADETARLLEHRVAGADPAPADELDRPERGRRGRLHHGARRAPGRGRRAARVHHPARHALRGDVHGARPGACARGQADGPRPSGGGRGVRRAGAVGDGDRAAVDRPREDGRLPWRGRHQPGQRRAHPDLDRGLRAGRLRHRRDHGGARPRRARLRVRHPVRAADPAGHRRARHRGRRARRRLHRPFARRAAGQLGPLQRPDRAGRDARDRRLAGRGRPGQADRHLPPAGLAVQPPALLGHADPGHLLRARRHRARPRRRPAGPAARRRSTTAGAARTR